MRRRKRGKIQSSIPEVIYETEDLLRLVQRDAEANGIEVGDQMRVISGPNGAEVVIQDVGR